MMQSNLQSFRNIRTACLGGFGVIALTQFPQLTSQFQVYQQQQMLKSAAELEQTKARLAAETAEVYKQNAIAQFDSLIVQDWTPDQPLNIDLKTSVDPTRKTLIYDKFRKCAGYALNGEFYPLTLNPDACGGNNP